MRSSAAEQPIYLAMLGKPVIVRGVTVLLPQRLPKEAPLGGRVALGAEQKIDGSPRPSTAR
jgi:hypothetical protein